MTYQRAANVLVALKAESTTGVAIATVTGAQQLRIIDSPGLTLSRAVIQSEEKRSDMLKTMGRLGYKSVEGSFNSELTPGGATDVLFEAVMRAAWATSVVVGFATMTGVAFTTNEVVASGGDWVGDQGIRVGDVFRITGHATASNNNLNVRVVAVGSTTIQAPSGTFTADASAATTGTLTVLRKLITSTSPTRRTFNVEQHDTDIDLSELFLGCRVTGLGLSCQPGQMAQFSVTFTGIDRTALATGTSPFFDAPTLTTTLALVADDSTIRFNGTDVCDFTGFDLNWSIDAAGEPVICSTLKSPDIFDNDCTVEGTVTGLREDFGNLTLYDAETEFELSILLQASGDAPKACLSVFLPRVKISGLSAPFGGGDGAKVETLNLMVAPKVAATGWDGTIALVASSEAP